MARVEGFYWVRERDEGSAIVAAFRGGEWTFGDGDGFAHELDIDVIAGPLMPPSTEQTAGWEVRYQQALNARKSAGQEDPTGGWDWLDGYYWVCAGDDPTPVWPNIWKAGAMRPVSESSTRSRSSMGH